MAESDNLPEWLSKLQDSFGLTNVRAKEDLALYFMSAYDRYDELKPSYVVRNASFLVDSIYITLSHALKPAKNPPGFGLALGSFLGFISKAKDHSVAEAYLKNEVTFGFLVKCVDLFKKIDGFDMEIIRERIGEMDISKLDSVDLTQFSRLLEGA